MTKSWPSRRSTPTVRKGDLREQQILDAAEDLLTTTGYADMTVADIAESVGITRAALYFYFGSKQEVLTALVARTVQVLRDRAAGAHATRPDRSTRRSVLRWNALRSCGATTVR